MGFWYRAQDVRAQPIVIGGLVLLPETDMLHALNRESGCSYWKFQTTARLRNAPVFDKEGGKYIFLIDSDFMVYKIDIITGKLLWKTKIPVEFDSNIPSASPVVSEDTPHHSYIYL